MKIDMTKEWLPVGTIVSIRFYKSKFMIVGYLVNEGDTDKVYDYAAVVYPGGFLDNDSFTLFNRDTVKKIHHIGYFTEEFKALSKFVEEKESEIYGQ